MIGPEVIAGLVSALAPHDSQKIGVCDWAILRGAGDEWVVEEPERSVRPLPEDPLGAWLDGWFVPSCSVLWTARGFEIVGGWDESVVVNHNGELMMRALLRGFQLVASEVGASLYRRDQAALSLGRRVDPGAFRGRIQVLEQVERLLMERGVLDEYRSPLAHAYYSVARAHFGTVGTSRLVICVGKAMELDQEGALPSWSHHRLIYRIGGATGLALGGQMAARLSCDDYWAARTRFERVRA